MTDDTKVDIREGLKCDMDELVRVGCELAFNAENVDTERVSN